MFLFHIIFIGFILDFSDCSLGDRTFTFHKCVGFCQMKFCTGEKFISLKRLPQNVLRRSRNSLVHKIEFSFLWTCPNECKYVCMWKTVEAFKNDGLKIPQFYGKWPLIRIFGIQEIASAIAAVLNFVVTSLMFRRFWLAVPKDSPCYNLWWLHYITACITWACATLFHISDVWLTEKLDYFSALLFVISASYVTVLRILELSNGFLKVLIGILFFAFFVFHISYLLLVRFDYTYNMMVFIIIGTINIISWGLWGFKNRKLPQSRYIILWAFCLSILSILEIKEFTPILWLFDSHSIWHFGTIFITIPLYKFAIVDCLYLRNLKFKYE